ncbi:MAG TPA: 50S ribosomal protein L11 methyltransferase [Thermoanaerobaculia bacterium]|nr:50S ribosomal protein L11 methyltransferase [Thermoanaerobaculia bacterium]
MSYLRRTYLVPPELEENASALLWEARTLGFTSQAEADGRVRVEAWFAGEASSDPLADLFEVECLPAERVEEQDWLAPYRERVLPFALGRTFFVDPREPGEETAVPPGRTLLRLPARTAFGTGSHESTRLALELLEDVAVAGRTVLDVGTGTGILAFAALALGAREAVAFDVDPAALFQARINRPLNGLFPRLYTGTVEALRPGARFDLAVVNIIPELFLPVIGEIAGQVAGGGEMVLSGILAERAGAVLAAVAEVGFAERARRVDGEWIGLRVGRGAP